MKTIVALLEPFKSVGKDLGSEKMVTSSLVIPLFGMLKEKLSAKPTDLAVM